MRLSWSAGQGVGHRCGGQAQAGRTYAGAEVSRGPRPLEKFPLCYSYLYNVKKAQRPAWPVMIGRRMSAGRRGLRPSAGIHRWLQVLAALQRHCFGVRRPAAEQTGQSAPARLRAAASCGAGIGKHLVSAMEPCRDRPAMKSVHRLTTEGVRAVALRVEFADGTVDRIRFNSQRRDAVRPKPGCGRS